MALRIEAGWNTTIVGAYDFLMSDSGGSVTVTLTSGTYCHTDLSSVLGSGQYTDFATQLTTDLNASALAGTYAVTYNPGSESYSWTCSETFGCSYTTDAGQRGMNALGFNATLSGVLSAYTGVVPYYVIFTDGGAKSLVSDVYEPDGMTETASAEDGTFYSVSPSELAEFYDFSVQFEAHAKTHERKAIAGELWTWSHFFAHVRGHHPFVSIDDNESLVHALRASGARAKPYREVEQWDTAWRIELATRYLGAL
ncbi:MAG: hypothetical protein GY944_29615 [bacterium]|nr:hypothetical protein [bacterium]